MVACGEEREWCVMKKGKRSAACAGEPTFYVCGCVAGLCEALHIVGALYPSHSSVCGPEKHTNNDTLRSSRFLVFMGRKCPIDPGFCLTDRTWTAGWRMIHEHM